jgi:hypothetical protein
VRRDGGGSTKGPFGMTDCVQPGSQDDLRIIGEKCNGYIACQEVSLVDMTLRCSMDKIMLAEYIDIFYTCSGVEYAPKWTSTDPNTHINHIICPIGTFISLKASYYVIPGGDPSQNDAISGMDCITPFDFTPLKSKCNGHIACDRLYIGPHNFSCNDEQTPAETFYLIYSCEQYIAGKYLFTCNRKHSLVILFCIDLLYS